MGSVDGGLPAPDRKSYLPLSVVAIAIGVAFGSAKLFDVSFALGAFFAGMMMRESQYSHRAADESLPLRDAFAVLFFVSVGMLFDPSVILEQPFKLLGVMLIILSLNKIYIHAKTYFVLSTVFQTVVL